MKRTSFLIAAVLCGMATAQQPKPADKPKPVEWPKLSSKQLARAKVLVRKLGADDEEVVAEAEAGLVELGAGTAKLLLRRLAGREILTHESIGRVLDATIEPRHAPLLAPLLERKQPQVRRYAAQRIARFHVPTLAPVLESVIEDKDELVVFYAALGLAGIGDFGHFDIVFDRCASEWREHAELVAETLTPVRGPKALKQLHESLDRRVEQQTQITALRFMRSLCPRTHASTAKGFLDAEDHAVKKEAINALRAIVDGDPPLENLSVFQAIEHAKKWKARV